MKPDVISLVNNLLMVDTHSIILLKIHLKIGSITLTLMHGCVHRATKNTYI
ncbi:hypothetical protein [uncultured Methanobrevibacter sp.]|uniref:hypothetical protein n=1 Tax=uncultured Methanobrevibacter sp. TaxID=253161 RepID=UPI00262582DA|nr:hypothetical protein [uncultured Methanobrevibacter sp.]